MFVHGKIILMNEAVRKWISTEFILGRAIFLRLLGVIYLIAFWSMGVQVDGLIGSQGILPVQPWLKAIDANYGTHARFLLPTLLWFNSSDRMLHILCFGGVALAGLLIIGVLPALTLFVLWAFYLSVTIGGQTFLGFQWDSLLLEAGFLAIFLAPMELMLWRKTRRPPSMLAIMLLRWLLFRVMFLSGVVKLSSGDLTWRAWTALTFHYQTQPLPPWTAWYFHHLPLLFQKGSVGVTWVAELLAPPLIFGPRKIRLIAFWIIGLFQMLIFISGNFGFFNLLTIALCFTLLDDISWPTRWRSAFVPRIAKPTWWWPMPLLAPLAMLVLIISGMQVADSFGGRINWPAPLVSIDSAIEPFRSINSYGLFRVMTTERIEIAIEGSDDGDHWKEYGFKWKPGNVDHRPAFCIGHMPRLDWQMWFAALSDLQNNPWFENLLIRIFQNSRPVLDLMGDNPFPDHPPKYLRAITYNYVFTTPAERRETGAWWKRELKGLYCPQVSMSN